MRLDFLTLVLTGRCNLACTYCRRRHTDVDMDPTQLDRAIDFFAPRINPGGVVNFTGGEPMMVFSLIRRAIRRLQKRDLRFALTTNGSLITPAIADFLENHRFTILLSWDGPLQASQRGAPRRVRNAVEILTARRGIRLETNTVVTPETVQELEPALREIHAAGITAMHVTPDRSAEWETASLAELARQFTRAGCTATRTPHTPLPLVSLPERSGAPPATCTAGRDRLAVSPEGEIWGCYRFVDFFDNDEIHVQRDRYSFGALEHFIARFPRAYHCKLPAYRLLRPAFYHTRKGLCLDCPDLAECGVCPVPFGSGTIGEIPISACRVQALLRRFSRPSCD